MIGESKAALEIAMREWIPADGQMHEIYGVDTLFDKVKNMDG